MNNYRNITLVTIPIVSIVIITALSLLSPETPDILVYAPFAISVLFLGLPHGGVDHLIPYRSNIGITKIQVILLYAVLMILYALFWYFNPVVSVFLFILITWVHWGQGDLYVYEEVTDSTYFVGYTDKILHVIIRGSLPMFVPLVFHKDTYETVISKISSLMFEKSNIEITQEIITSVSILLLMTFAFYCAILIYNIKTSEYEQIQYFGTDIVEVLLLVLYFAIVPPILAIGIYFCIWHSLRHIIRIIGTSNDLSKPFSLRLFFQHIRDFARDSMLTTIVSVLIATIMFFFLSTSNYNLLGILGVYLVLISLLTPPHFVVVTLMDRNDNIW
jgi:Brp/Blh family beta-carotene 15,15'-monooxygenase